MATAENPRNLPHRRDISATPKVWPVMGTGVNERGIEICASKEMTSEPPNVANTLYLILLPYFTMMAGTNDCCETMGASYQQDS